MQENCFNDLIIRRLDPIIWNTVIIISIAIEILEIVVVIKKNARNMVAFRHFQFCKSIAFIHYSITIQRFIHINRLMLVSGNHNKSKDIINPVVLSILQTPPSITIRIRIEHKISFGDSMERVLATHINRHFLPDQHVNQSQRANAPR